MAESINILQEAAIKRLSEILKEAGSYYFEYRPEKEIAFVIRNPEGQWVKEERFFELTVQYCMEWLLRDINKEDNEVRTAYNRLGAALKLI